MDIPIASSSRGGHGREPLRQLRRLYRRRHGVAQSDAGKNGHSCGSEFFRGWTSYRDGSTISAMTGISRLITRESTITRLTRLAT